MLTAFFDGLIKIPWYTDIGLISGLIALFVTGRNYRRKSGISVRGSFTFTSTISCSDKYISYLVLENLKDRAVTIFSIYLKIGYGTYIKLDDFSDSPLTLRSFETIHRDYGPMEFYTSNCRRLDLKDLMEDARAKKRIVLSTSGGKYVVPDNLPQWSPIHEVLRNHYTAVIDIIRVSHKGHDVGDRVKFVVESIRPGRDPDILLIHYDDAGRRIWADVAPSAESLKSRDSLQIFLKEQVLLGKIPECVFFVYDMDQWRSSNRTRYGSERVPLGNVGFFEYYLWGRLHTVLFNRKLRAQNRRSLSASNEDQNKKNTDSELPEIG